MSVNYGEEARSIRRKTHEESDVQGTNGQRPRTKQTRSVIEKHGEGSKEGGEKGGQMLTLGLSVGFGGRSSHWESLLKETANGQPDED